MTIWKTKQKKKMEEAQENSVNQPQLEIQQPIDQPRVEIQQPPEEKIFSQYDFIFQSDNMYDLWHARVGWKLSINNAEMQEATEIILSDSSNVNENNEVTEEGIQML